MSEEAQATPSLPPREAAGSEQSAAPSDEASTAVRLEIVGRIGQYPISEAVKGLIQAGVRGESGMVLLYTLTQKLESDLREAREEVRQLRTEIEKWRTDYYATKEDRAVLAEQLEELRKRRWLQNVMITLGGIVVGVAVPYLIAEPNGASFAAVVLGAVLLLLGWLRGDKK